MKKVLFFILPLTLLCASCNKKEEPKEPIIETVHVESISLSETTKELNVGESFFLSYNVEPFNADNKSVTWSSSNESVATVSNGTVQAVAAGETVITVTTVDQEKTASCTVTVKKNAVTRTISLLDSYEHGNVEVNKYFAKEGETITLTITVDEGYELLEGNLKYNETVISGNSFVMPDENVTIYALFTAIPIIYPETDNVVIAKVNEKEAKGFFEAKYVQGGVLFKTTVVDEDRIDTGYDLDQKDSIGILCNKASDKKGMVPDQTIYFRSDSTGYYQVRRAQTRSNYSQNFEPKINIYPGINFYTYVYNTELGNESAYVVVCFIGYDLMGTDYENGYQQITMCPQLVNANSDGVTNEMGQRGESCYSFMCYWQNASTFALINGENSFIRRATGTEEDVLDNSILPDGYIPGANFTGRSQWSVAWIKLSESVSLENVSSFIIEVRFNESNANDWFRMAACLDDGTFLDAFGKDTPNNFHYSCSPDLRETANYEWETGQWGGWDPSWNSGPISPTYYVEVPLVSMFARFNIKTGNMTTDPATPGSELLDRNLAQIGIYTSADANYNFTIGNTYVRRNGSVEQISNREFYSTEEKEGFNLAYASKVDSDSEKESKLEVNCYQTPED